jgi:hypothetical protein
MFCFLSPLNALLCVYVFQFWQYIFTIKYIIMNIILYINNLFHEISYVDSTLCYFQRLLYLHLKMRTIYVLNALTFIQFSIKLLHTHTRTHILRVMITNSNTNIIMYIIVGTLIFFLLSRTREYQMRIEY